MSLAPSTDPAGWRDATIERIVARTARIRSYFLRTAPAPQLAGQHLDVRLTADDGYQARRSYSIASAPDAPDGLVELAIERLDDGEVSGYFHDVAQVGDTIEVLGPVGGHFVWTPDDPAGALLLIAGGSGIVPLRAMLQQRARQRPQPPALLLYSARTQDEFAFRDEVLAMEAADPLLRIVLATTRGAPQRPQDLGRRFDAGALRDALAGWGRAPERAYVCGATRFVEAMAGALVGLGVDAARVRTERYGGVD